MRDEHLEDALKPKSGSDAMLDFLVQSALNEAAEEYRKSKATPKEWSQKRQDFLVRSALKEAAENTARQKINPVSSDGVRLSRSRVVVRIHQRYICVCRIAHRANRALRSSGKDGVAC